ncbi:5'-nucleotidase surE [Senna tora]|uniref:5'-nucleotidase surE n=1 Tax=Senna tora TaxID=362788 RepID=A0A835CDX8_9FABA|nr:5'-nucleotidase surE [Senna tora]KAF7837901.1 5'-nucleotidase surE [Senna tora]
MNLDPVLCGTPADCISLALSGALFSWTKPLLVISGINRGAAFAGAREALICGVPSLCISLNWKENVSSENDEKDAVSVCLPLIHAVIRDIKKGIFPNSCFLNIGIPSCPLRNKCMIGCESDKAKSIEAVARGLNSQRKNVEIESVGVAGKLSSSQTETVKKKYFRMEMIEKERECSEEDADFRALEEGFVKVIPLSLHPNTPIEIHSSVSNWLAVAFTGDR